jgi:hypothetical protein
MFNRTSKHVLNFMRSSDEFATSTQRTLEMQSEANFKIFDWLRDLTNRLDPIEKVLPPLAEVVQQTIETDASQNVAIHGLIDRLEFLENLLRNNEIHEVDCPVMAVARHNSRGQTYMMPQPCTCWLNNEEESEKD